MSEDAPGDRHAAERDDKAKPAEGLSQFLGKVLDQLSISAWFPASMLVGNVALLAQLRSQRSLDIGKAVTALTEKPLGIVIVLLFALVLGTIVTQAFQFEAIRLFEGYWEAGRFRSLLATVRIKHHVKARAKLERAQAEQVLRACGKAWKRMIDSQSDASLIITLQQLLNSGRATNLLARQIQDADETLSWSEFCPAQEMRRLEAIERRFLEYPSENRILPTRLGNTLRSREELLNNVEGELEVFILRNYERIPDQLRTQHDQFRNRLDMYCSLVFVFIVLTAAGPAFLLDTPGRYFVASIGCLGLYATLTIVSYRAAVTSARGYGSMLVTIDEKLTAGTPPILNAGTPPTLNVGP